MDSQLNPELGEYDIFLAMGPADVQRAIAFLIPVFHYVPGDADYNGIVDGRDFFGFPRYWLSGKEVPAGIDYDHNRKIEVSDLLEFLAP